MSFDEPRPASQKRANAKTSAKASLLRPKILSDEEKRQLIMAHAVSRKPIDHVQRISLVAGVLVCALAIGAGWLYSVRMSMAEVFPKEQTREDSEKARAQYRQDIQAGTESIIKEIEKIENENILPKIKTMMVTTTAPVATPTSTQPKQSVKKSNLPPGLTPDSQE